MFSGVIALMFYYTVLHIITNFLALLKLLMLIESLILKVNNSGNVAKTPTQDYNLFKGVASFKDSKFLEKLPFRHLLCNIYLHRHHQYLNKDQQHH